MPDDELLGLVSTLSRLTHPRCATPRVDALRKAYRRIRTYALQRGLKVPPSPNNYRISCDFQGNAECAVPMRDEA